MSVFLCVRIGHLIAVFFFKELNNTSALMLWYISTGVDVSRSVINMIDMLLDRHVIR